MLIDAALNTNYGCLLKYYYCVHIFEIAICLRITNVGGDVEQHAGIIIPACRMLVLIHHVDHALGGIGLVMSGRLQQRQVPALELRPAALRLLQCGLDGGGRR